MLRVIAGKFRSRKLNEVNSKLTRPTTDKNKETMFNSIGQFFDGGYALDLYAGSGALGIEAISRGIEQCDFVDQQYQAIKTIKQNLASLGILSSHQVIKKESITFLTETQETYDLILMDPPYDLKPYKACLEVIHSRQLLNKHGIIVLESDHLTDIDDYQDLMVLKVKTLGQSRITIMGRK